MKTFLKIGLSCLFLAISLNGYTQCKNFTRKKCLPTLKPFTSDGQIHQTSLRAGEGAEVELTMYKGQSYRLIICYQEVLEEVRFKLLDRSYNVIYESEESNKNYWDFQVENTQQMIVQVFAKSQGKQEIVPSGCVAVALGFKDAK